MDKILTMKRIFIALALLAGAVISASAQKFTYKWERVPMDTTWMKEGTSKVEEIIAKYQPGIENLMEIIGYSSEELSKGNPESGLSNLAADALLHAAQPLLKEGDKAFSLTNFGGIRANLPKGAIRVYDIYSTFPFDNSLVIVELPGWRVREIMKNFAKRERFEALGGVKIEVKDKGLKKCYIGGEKLNDDKIYKLVTIDFLLDGGDALSLRKGAKEIVISDIFVRDGVVKYIKEKSDAGHVFNNQKDGRIVIK
jgi:2',3'-cyclic-nucleotide 2'-phosphodiesterase (5'-nucleotidase family)